MNCSKERMSGQVLMRSPFKCIEKKISHTSRCLNLLLSTVTASLWFQWMDDTVSWGDLMLSCFTMMLSHKSLRYCTLEDCHFVLVCCRLRNKTRLPEQSPSNQPGFAYQQQHRALYPHMLLRTRFSPFFRRTVLPFFSQCPSGWEGGLTETLQISGPSKLALIPLWSLT